MRQVFSSNHIGCKRLDVVVGNNLRGVLGNYLRSESRSIACRNRRRRSWAAILSGDRGCSSSIPCRRSDTNSVAANSHVHTESLTDCRDHQAEGVPANMAAWYRNKRKMAERTGGYSASMRVPEIVSVSADHSHDCYSSPRSVVEKRGVSLNARPLMMNGAASVGEVRQ